MAGKEAVRRFFVPYPEVDSFEELNEYLHNECIRLWKAIRNGKRKGQL